MTRRKLEITIIEAIVILAICGILAAICFRFSNTRIGEWFRVSAARAI